MTKTTAIGLALLSAALFGASTTAAKLLLGEISPWLLTGLLYLGSGLGLSAVLAVRALRGGTVKEAALGRAGLQWLAGAVLCGGVAGPVLLMAGVSHTPASSAAMMAAAPALAGDGARTTGER
jgi:drug/metabolite transporter (DMT)-like permease